jgi:Ca-activated chloride channel family protein
VVVALAQPEMPRVSQATSVEGVDIVLALDISRSMRAEDFAPNRLDAAKEVLRKFVRRRVNDRIGLVVFAGDAFLQCPLTLDHDALEGLIESADFSLTDTEGTAIGDALAKAAARLKESPSRSRIIILLTDGENNRGNIDPQTAARTAAALGMKIYAVGVGGTKGAPIPMNDPIYGKVFTRNADGSLLLTRLDAKLLGEIAETTGGRYFNAQDNETLDNVYREIDRLERSVVDRRMPPTYRSVAHVFYLAAFVVVLIEAVLTRTTLRTLP